MVPSEWGNEHPQNPILLCVAEDSSWNTPSQVKQHLKECGVAWEHVLNQGIQKNIS
jgi:hypothetical protein